MPEIFADQPVEQHTSQKPPVRNVPHASLNPTGLIIIIILILLVPGFLVYGYIHAKQGKLNQDTRTVVVKTASITRVPQPSQKPTESITPTTSVINPVGKEVYTLPSGWESVKTAGDDTSYQLVFRPKGETDTPLTLNVYKNATSVPFDQFVNMRIGEGYPRTTVSTKGKSGVYAKKDGFESYFFTMNGTYYELSAATGDAQLHQQFQKIYNSFTIK